MVTAKKKAHAVSGMRKTSSKRSVPITWRVVSFFGAWVRRDDDDRQLFVYVAQGGADKPWIALAVEGPTGIVDPRAILDDHGHRLIGEFANGPAAQRASEGFAKKWLRGHVRIEDCACEEVAA